MRHWQVGTRRGHTEISAALTADTRRRLTAAPPYICALRHLRALRIARLASDTRASRDLSQIISTDISAGFTPDIREA